MYLGNGGGFLPGLFCRAVPTVFLVCSGAASGDPERELLVLPGDSGGSGGGTWFAPATGDLGVRDSGGNLRALEKACGGGGGFIFTQKGFRGGDNFLPEMLAGSD